MYPMLEHPDISCALRTGNPSWMPDEDEIDVINDEDDEEYESELWGDECEDRIYEERRESALFDD